MHFVLFHDCDNFSKKHEHQSNKCQQIFVHYLCIPRFMCLWFPPTLFFPYDLNFAQQSNHMWDFSSEWGGFATLPFKTMHLKYMLYSCAWCEDSLLLLYDMPPYLKKVLHFRLLKLLFQYYITIYIVVCYSVLFSVLIHSITHPKTIAEGGKL